MRLAAVLAVLLAVCLVSLPGCGEQEPKPAGKKDSRFRGMKKPTDRFNTDRRPNK
jgi:hypothetical protein